MTQNQLEAVTYCFDPADNHRSHNLLPSALEATFAPKCDDQQPTRKTLNSTANLR